MSRSKRKRTQRQRKLVLNTTTLNSPTKPSKVDKTNNFHRITANFTGMVRHDTMEGRDYLVAPMVMIVEGVLNGSEGAFYYPAEQLGKTPAVWNHKPIVVYHPIENGVGVSACSPEIINKYKIGMIMNTKYDVENRLTAEAWMEEGRINEVDDRVLTAINEKKPMELSTGLFTDSIQEEGEFDGVHYDATAVNYRPDHLALLPDLTGACSLADGAGFLRNSAQQQAHDKREDKPKDPSFAENQQSHDNLRQVLSGLLRAKIEDAWIEDVFDGFFIYENGGKFFRQEYKEGEVAGAEFVGEPVQVVRVTEYRTLDGTFIGNQSKEIDVDKKKVVEAIIKNSNWAETDRELLMSMNEDQLTKLSEEKKPEDVTPSAPTEETTPAAKPEVVEDNAEGGDKKPTLEEFLANAPPEYRDMVVSGINTHNRQKAILADKILGNEANTFTKETLHAMDLEQLTSIAALAVKPEEKGSGIMSMADFSGQGDAGPDTNAVKEEALVMPVMNFGDEK